MTQRKCMTCGSWFEAYNKWQHVCESCESSVDLDDEKPAPEPAKPQGKGEEKRDA